MTRILYLSIPFHNRLTQIRGMAQEIQTLCAELLAEPIRDSQDMLHIARAERFADAINAAMTATYTEPK
jgi:hypothetical protein